MADYNSESRSDAENAWNTALRKLSRKERTSQEIRLYLMDRGFSPDLIEATLIRLFELKFLDDRRYSEAFTRLQAMREKGPAVIRMKLKRKGLALSTEEIQKIIGEAQGKSDLERAIEIVRRRYPDFRVDRAVTKKAYDALIRRGFSFDIARSAINAKAESD